MSKSNENKGFGYITGYVLACVVFINPICFVCDWRGDWCGLSIGIAATVAAAFGCAAVLVVMTVRKVLLELRSLRMDRERLIELCREIVDTSGGDFNQLHEREAWHHLRYIAAIILNRPTITASQQGSK